MDIQRNFQISVDRKFFVVAFKFTWLCGRPRVEYVAEGNGEARARSVQTTFYNIVQ
jgi:hypothetical protein